MIGGLSAETVTEAKNRIVQILTGVALYYMIGFILRTVLPFFFKWKLRNYSSKPLLPQILRSAKSLKAL